MLVFVCVVPPSGPVIDSPPVATCNPTNTITLPRPVGPVRNTSEHSPLSGVANTGVGGQVRATQCHTGVGDQVGVMQGHTGVGDQVEVTQCHIGSSDQVGVMQGHTGVRCQVEVTHGHIGSDDHVEVRQGHTNGYISPISPHTPTQSAPMFITELDPTQGSNTRVSPLQLGFHANVPTDRVGPTELSPLHWSPATSEHGVPASQEPAYMLHTPGILYSHYAYLNYKSALSGSGCWKDSTTRLI
jgi:hypothetical protein